MLKFWNDFLFKYEIFLDKITLKRFINLLFLAYNYILSIIFKRPFISGYPMQLMVEPSSACNLKCPFCARGANKLKRPVGIMKLENFKKVMKEIGEYLYFILFWNQGEPFVNPNFLEMIKIAKSYGIYTLTSTNGHFIKDEKTAEEVVASGLDVLIISLDGATEESYKFYRAGGDFETVIKAIELLAQAKNKLNSYKPYIEMQFLIMKHNQNEMKEIVKLATQLGANAISYKTLQVNTVEEAKINLPDNPKYTRYIKEKLAENTLRVKGNLPNRCFYLWFGSIINEDGSVNPCCFDKDTNYTFGNVFENSKMKLKDIWHNKDYQNFRQQILENRKNIPMCLNCLEGVPVFYKRVII